mgnify:CR=1 FL=1
MRRYSRTNFEKMSSNQECKKGLWDEICDWWRRQPDKLLFACLLIPWILLFHFWGNITLGYVKTHSLFEWMHYVFSTSSDDEHGMLIPFVVLALFFWKREELLASVRGIWWPALGIVILALVIHLVGYRVQQTRLSIVAFFTGIYGLLGLVWGADFMRRSFFPMFLFAFCVPLGTEADRITAPLRVMASKITSGIANGLFGIGVIRDGTRLFDPAGQYQYEVAAACSGIRSLTAVLAFSTIFGFVSFRKNWRRGLMILAAFPLAVASNVMRLLMIVLAAELFGQEAGNYVHESSWLSLLPYIPAMGGVVILGYLLREPKPAATPASQQRELQPV